MNHLAFYRLCAALWMGAALAPITTQHPMIRRAIYGE